MDLILITYNNMQSFKKLNSYEETIGTSFKGVYLHTDTIRLYNLLGDPSIEGSGDNKTKVEWIYKEIKTCSFQDVLSKLTIYDYKSDKSVIDETYWHIGGYNISFEQIKSFLISKGFEESEIKNVR